jgi:hypothetical protein
MASNVFSQNFATQAPFGDLTLADNAVAGGLLSFQDFPASQDHCYEFNDFSQVRRKCLMPGMAYMQSMHDIQATVAAAAAESMMATALPQRTSVLHTHSLLARHINRHIAANRVWGA